MRGIARQRFDVRGAECLSYVENPIFAARGIEPIGWGITRRGAEEDERMRRLVYAPPRRTVLDVGERQSAGEPRFRLISARCKSHKTIT